MKLLAIFAALLLSSCAMQGVHPAGFAPYEQGFRAQDYKAVSPEGVTWRIHHEEHKPQADLEFWKGALRKRMSDAGYRILDSVSFVAQGQNGFALELEAPLGQDDFRYLVGAVPYAKTLVVIEAAGPVADYTKHRAALLHALSQVSP